MKTLARKVEDFVRLAIVELADKRVPIFGSTSFDSEVTFPSVCIETETGWMADSPFLHGHRTATVVVSVRTKADDTRADLHDEIAAIVEAYLAHPDTVLAAASTVSDFRLVEWTPGSSTTSVEERVRVTTFNYSARVRDDGGTSNV